MYLYADFRQVNLESKFFSCVDIGVVRFLERSFKLVKLKCREGCAIPSVFLL